MSKLTNNTGPLLRSTRVLLLVAIVALAGCGRNDAVQEVGADQLYAQGQEHLLNNNFAGAIISFQNLVIRYPFSPSARQAQLDLVYAYYRSGQPEAALDVAQTFRRENPRLPEVAYSLYMIGLIHFDRERNFIERIFRVDITERPPKESQLAFDAFQELIVLYPDSKWVEDARQRMIYRNTFRAGR
jgi:outer membrane protein assembly factor BamD